MAVDSWREREPLSVTSKLSGWLIFERSMRKVPNRLSEPENL